jgi:two-component system, chemotaxis family, protein-glutamate methylesterase/glutaminase
VTTKKRVLLVDDSVMVRTALAQAIRQDGDLEVAGTAANGRIALAKFSALKPDIVLLDFEMPEMDGLETVRQLRKINPSVPIIMFSSLTERGASLTLEALSLGATDYVTKPSTLDVAATLQTISQELLAKLRAFCHLPETPAASPAVKPQSQSPQLIPSRPRALSPVQIVAIGVSTGGPDALARVLPCLPADFPVPFAHRAAHASHVHIVMLAARLSAKSALPVRECASGEPLLPGAP